MTDGRFAGVRQPRRLAASGKQLGVPDAAGSLSSSAPPSGGLGLRAPLWFGAGLALLGILTLVPDLVPKGRPQERQGQVVP